jgi:hypothetical protein
MRRLGILLLLGLGAATPPARPAPPPLQASVQIEIPMPPLTNPPTKPTPPTPPTTNVLRGPPGNVLHGPPGDPLTGAHP